MQSPVFAELYSCYIGKLDDDQFYWLEHELIINHNTPVCTQSHIPLLCACEYFDGENEKLDYWEVSAAWMHIASRRIRNLFLDH